MKRVLKKLLILLIMVVIMCPFVNRQEVKANNVGTIKLSVDNTEVEKNGTVKVTVTVAANTPLTIVNYSLKYDSKYFTCQGYAGIIVNQEFDTEDAVGFTTASKTYIFTAKEVCEEGAAFELIVNDGDVITNDLKEGKLAITNATVKVIDKKASGNANLSGIELSTGYLWPEFDPNHTVYAVGLDNSITSLSIATPTQDAKASVTFDASKLNDLKVGRIDIDIIVTAENGTKKKYVLEVTRYPKEEESTQAPTQGETESATQGKDERLTAKVDGKDYLVVRDISGIQLPEGFELSVLPYNGTDIGIAHNKENGLILAYLVDDNANSEFYIVDKLTGGFSKYTVIKDDVINYVLMTPNKMLENMISVKMDVGGANITTWTTKDIEDIYFFYAMNSKGEKKWYSYDAKEKTIQRAYTLDTNVSVVEKDETLIKELESAKDEIARLNRENTSLRTGKKDNSGEIGIIIALAIAAILLLIAFIALMSKLREVRDENDMYKAKNDEIDKELKEVKSLVAYTEEKFSKEREAEKLKFEEEKKEKITKEAVLENEITNAMDKISEINVDDAIEYKFDYSDDDDIFILK